MKTKIEWADDQEIGLSICCLTHNHHKTISDAINGFLAQQTNFRIEIFIHDDASTDGAVEILNEYEQKYPDLIHVKYSSENLYSKGMSLYDIYTTRAFPELKGKYIAICEGDDYWTDPLKLQKQIDFLEANSNFTVCFHDAGFIGGNNTDFEEHKKHFAHLLNHRSEFEFVDLLNENFIPNCSVVYRNNVDVYPRDFSKTHFPDWPLHLVFARKGNVKYLPETMAVHRKQEDGVWEGETLTERYQNVYKFYILLMKYAGAKHFPVILQAIDLITKDELKVSFSEALQIGYAMRSEELEPIIREQKLLHDQVFNSNTWKLANDIRIISEKVLPNSATRKRMALLSQKTGEGIFRKLNLLPDATNRFKKYQRKKRIKNLCWPENTPLVSIIIPNVNYGKFLPEAIGSACNQTFKNIEILVIDGGSDDPYTIEVVSKIKHPLVKVYQREKRYMLGSNRNFGIEKAKGKYICSLDADDKIEPSYIEKAVFLLEAFRYDIVYPWVQSFGDSNEIWKTSYADYNTLTSIGNTVAVLAVYRKDVWKTAGKFKDYPIGRGHVSEDWEFWVRAAGHGFRFKNMNESLMRYRVHNSSMSAKSLTPIEEQKRIIIEDNVAFNAPPFVEKRKKASKLNFDVKNPFINLKQKSHKKHLMIALPLMIMGGVDTIFLNIFGFLSQFYEITFFTTLEFSDEFGDNTKAFEKITPRIYHLSRFLNTNEERKKFILYLVEAHAPDLLLIAGSEMTYHSLPKIKKHRPDLKVVDFLFNESGHIKNNRRYSRYIHMNIVENEKIVETLKNTYREKSDKIKLIHNGVNLLKYAIKGNGGNFRQKYNIPQEAFLVAYLGRFSSEKNPKAVLQMAQELKDENIYFLMGGKGPMFDEVLCEIKNKGLHQRILSPGIINTVDALQAADVMVLPSILDGRPNAVLEAMASSVPVIASAVGGLPTIIEHGKNGFLAKPENVDEFINYILKLKNTPGLKQQIGTRALEYAQQVLDDKIMLNTYNHTIEQVLK